MGFRNKEGDYLGSQNNYQYTGKRSLDQRSTKKSYTNIIAILVIIVFLAALFLLYVALLVKDPNVSEREYLFSSITLFILAFYIIDRFRKSKREEAKYKEELQKLKNDQ